MQASLHELQEQWMALSFRYTGDLRTELLAQIYFYR